MDRRSFLTALFAFVLAPRGSAKHPRREVDPDLEPVVMGALLMYPHLLSQVVRILPPGKWRGEETSRVLAWMVERKRHGQPYGYRALVTAKPENKDLYRRWVENVPRFESAPDYARELVNRREEA